MILGSLLPSDFWTDQTIPILGHLFGLLEYVVIGGGLTALYAVLPSYGLSIIMLTFCIRFALFPLMSKQTRSMRKMSKLQVEIRNLQQRYKNDRERLREEQMALFKANNANPVSGCLPLLLQMPILLAMFRVFNASENDALPGAAATNFIPEGSNLFKDIIGSTLENASAAMKFFWMNLGASPAEVFSKRGEIDGISLVSMIPYLLMLAAIGVTGWWQMQQTAQRNKSQTQNQPAAAQSIQKVMPFVFLFVSWGFASAVSLYLLTSNVFSIGQQWWILRRDDEDEEIIIPKPQKLQKSPKQSISKRANTKTSARSGQSQSGQKPTGARRKDQTVSNGAMPGSERKKIPKKVPPRSKKQQTGGTSGKPKNETESSNPKSTP